MPRGDVANAESVGPRCSNGRIARIGDTPMHSHVAARRPTRSRVNRRHGDLQIGICRKLRRNRNLRTIVEFRLTIRRLFRNGVGHIRDDLERQIARSVVTSRQINRCLASSGFACLKRSRTEIGVIDQQRADDLVVARNIAHDQAILPHV